MLSIPGHLVHALVPTLIDCSNGEQVLTWSLPHDSRCPTVTTTVGSLFDGEKSCWCRRAASEEALQLGTGRLSIEVVKTGVYRLEYTTIYTGSP